MATFIATSSSLWREQRKKMEKVKIRNSRGKLIHIRLSENLHTRLKIRVAELKTTIQSWTVTNIRNGLQRKRKLKVPLPVKPISERGSNESKE